MKLENLTFSDLGGMTLPVLFDQRVQETPDALALRSVVGQMTFGEWYAATTHLSSLLRDSSVPLAHRAALLWMSNEEALTFACALQTVVAAGATAIALDDREAVSEALRIIAEAEPSVLLIGGHVRRNLGPDGLEALGAPFLADIPADALAVAPIRDGAVAEASAWSPDYSASSGALTPGDSVKPEDLALLAYTSGSTGAPKGIPITQSGIAQYAERITRYIFAEPRRAFLSSADVLQSPIPIYTTANIIENLYPTVFSGCTLIAEGNRFNASESEQRMHSNGTTVYSGVPSHYAMICDLPHRTPPASLQLAVTNGAPLTAALYQRMRKRWPAARLANWWGMNESGIGQTLNFGEDLEGDPTSIGRPVWPTKIRIVDADGTPVSHGAEGELWLQAPGQVTAYYRNPELTADRIRDGWLRTGDYAREDPDGLLHVVGRSEDRINRGGFKFYPVELESVLTEHPGVREAAVVAVPHRTLGEDAVAFVVPAAGQMVTEEGLRDHCRRRVARNKVPSRVIFVDDFPRGNFGKVSRRRLMDSFLTPTQTSPDTDG